MCVFLLVESGAGIAWSGGRAACVLREQQDTIETTASSLCHSTRGMLIVYRQDEAALFGSYFFVSDTLGTKRQDPSKTT